MTNQSQKVMSLYVISSSGLSERTCGVQDVRMRFMISMSCQCINCIFGELGKQIGVEKFEKKRIFKNLSDGLKSLILMIVNENLK